MRILCTFVLIAAAASPALAGYGDPLEPISTSGLGLTWHATPAAALTNADALLPNVGVATLLAGAPNTIHTCLAGPSTATDGTSSFPITPASLFGLCWSATDEATDTWTPQGVTTSGDADDDGMWGANAVILASWHYNIAGDRYNETRVSFIDANNTAADSLYRHVYLVQLNADGSDFTAVKAHGGGMIWYGDKLFVVAVGNNAVAIRVFSMSHILATTDSSTTAIGKTSAGYAAYGYSYVMPQIGYYTYEGGTCSMDTDAGVPCLSSISLDRSTSPDSMVTTEYFSDQTMRGRLLRYSFGDDFLLAAAPAVEAFRSGVGNMQGVLSWQGVWWVAHSSATAHGQLWRQTPTSSTVQTCTSPDSSPNMCWALHPEAMSYNVATGLVWSITEYANARALFATPLVRFDSAVAGTDAGVSDPGGDAGTTTTAPEHHGGCNAGASQRLGGLGGVAVVLLLRRRRR